jgi:hypothetical protein
MAISLMMFTLLDLLCFLLLLAKGGKRIIFFFANKLTMKNERNKHQNVQMKMIMILMSIMKLS